MSSVKRDNLNSDNRYYTSRGVLFALRKSRHQSQLAFANEAGWTIDMQGNYEDGTTPITTEVRDKLVAKQIIEASEDDKWYVRLNEAIKREAERKGELTLFEISQNIASNDSASDTSPLAIAQKLSEQSDLKSKKANFKEKINWFYRTMFPKEQIQNLVPEISLIIVICLISPMLIWYGGYYRLLNEPQFYFWLYITQAIIAIISYIWVLLRFLTKGSIKALSALFFMMFCMLIMQLSVYIMMPLLSIINR